MPITKVYVNEHENRRIGQPLGFPTRSWPMCHETSRSDALPTWAARRLMGRHPETKGSAAVLSVMSSASRQRVQPDRSEIDMHEAHDATHLDAPIDCCSRG